MGEFWLIWANRTIFNKLKKGGRVMKYYVINGVVYFSRKAAQVAKEGK